MTNTKYEIKFVWGLIIKYSIRKIRSEKIMIKLTLIISFAFFFLSVFKTMAQEENLSVLSGWRKWKNAPNMLYNHLNDQAFDYLAEREAKIAGLKTEALWIRRQEEVRQTLMEIVGPLPEKTPLNPRVVGVIDKEGYRVEKIIYESMPNLFVTACLFIPDDLQGKTPAILNPIGHSQAAFRRPLYQQVILNLVKKGFIVLTFDPIGQGERLQYFDPEKGESRIGGPTSEHSYVGAQCFISGSSLARYWVWDGIRAMDYLLTRREVDPQRIGITGLSGGGTATSYIAAFDDRIWAAAPAGYITSFKRLLESIGPQDAEQNFYHGIASGIDHADLLEVRAPKPAMLIATTRDYFSIQGSRETYQEVKKSYQAKGFEANFVMAEDDYTHGYTQKTREATYAFFQKHLNLPGSSADEELELLSPEELQVTDTGQISTSLGGETVFSINRSESEKLLHNLEESRKNLTKHLQAVKGMAKELSGYVRPDQTSQVVFTGRYQREGYSVEKYMLEGEGECVIPLLLMLPDEGANHPAVIYIHPDGKAAEASEGGQMEWFVKQGFAVLSPDLIGTGETGSGKSSSYTEWFESILIARSIVGIRAGDIVRTVKYLESREDIDYNNISAVALGEMCPVLLHAAAFCESISKIALVEPLISYRSIVMNRYYNPRFIPAAVAGALTAYDLADLAACLAPRKLLMINITNQNGDRAASDLIEKDLAVVRSAYSAVNAKEKWEMKIWEDEQSIDEIFSSWLLNSELGK